MQSFSGGITVSIEKLTRGNPTMAAKFSEIKIQKPSNVE